MRFFLYWIQVFFFLLILSSCSTSNNLSSNELNTHLISSIPINYSLFDTTDINVIDEKAIFELSPSQQKEFLAYYDLSIQRGIEPHKALSHFLSSEMSDFTYYGETYTAEKAMRLRAGNCMSLAIWTTALSKLINLEFSYREVNTLPVFVKHNNVILSSSHVQTMIYDPSFIPDEDFIYSSRPGIAIDYFPTETNRLGRKFLQGTFLASYYQNIASDALVEGDLNKSFAYALKAKAMDPSNTKVINFLAVLHKKQGDFSTAEKIYQIGLQNNRKNVTLLSNYISLLKAQERWDEMDEIQFQLDDLNDPNPYHWLSEAYTAQDNQKYTKAINYYKKVIVRAPYVHQAYKGLYQIYHKQGKFRQAKEMLKRALEWTYELEDKKLYKYKLYSLNLKNVNKY